MMYSTVEIKLCSALHHAYHCLSQVGGDQALDNPIVAVRPTWPMLGNILVNTVR